MASIVAADLVAYASINVAGDPPGPTADGTLTGGDIDALYQVIFSTGQIGASALALEVVSSSGSDTGQTIEVIARHADGTLETNVPETALNGTSAVAILFPVGGNTVLNVQSISLSATALGIVTVRVVSAGATIHAIPIGELGAIRLFRNATSVVGSATTRYEKFFLKNTNGTNALLSATVDQTADGSGRHDFTLAASVDDNATIADRATGLPAGSFGKVLINVPGGTIGIGSAIGVWVKQTLGDGESPILNAQDTVTHQLAGDTT